MAAGRGRLAAGFGLVAGVAALAAGGIAMGIELERRIVSKRIARSSEADLDRFFALRSDGPEVTTPDGVVLHTEVDTGAAKDVTLVFVHGYGLNLDCWYFQRKHFRGQLRQVLYDQRSHGRSGRSEAELCRIPQLAEDLFQVLRELVGTSRVILIGHSMGGMTIMRLAQSRPELFGSQVLGVALFCTSAGEMADYLPAFREFDEYHSLEIVGTVPTLVIGGENDMMTPIEHTARIIDLLPKAEAIRIENCGHLGMIEKHYIFNGALDRLLARVREGM